MIKIKDLKNSCINNYLFLFLFLSCLTLEASVVLSAEDWKFKQNIMYAMFNGE